MRPTLKTLSLDQQCEAARRAVYAALEQVRRAHYRAGLDDEIPHAYPVLVYPDYVIVQEGIQYFKVPYTIADGSVTVPARADWQPTEQTWKSLPVLDSLSETTIAVGGTGAVKALGDGKVGGYLVQFSTKSDPDLSGEFFTADTDFDVEDGAQTAVYYHHGMDPTLKTRKLGTGTIKKDDVGVWVEAQLSMRDAYEKQVYKLAEAGKLGWSSGTAVHLAEYKPAGKATEITRWPLGLDASLTPTPAEPRTRVLPLKSYDPPQAALTGADAQRSDASADATPPSPQRAPSPTKRTTMTPEEIQAMVERALKAHLDRETAAAQAKADEEARTAAAVKSALETAAAEWAASNRLPGGNVNVPIPLKYHDVAKYDGLDAADMAVVIGVLEGQQTGRGARLASEQAYKALAIKLDESQTKTGEYVRQAFKAAGIKANEVQYSTLTSFGDEWVSIAYSNAIWDQIRQGTFVTQRLSSIEVPQGAESIVLPLDGADPVFYKVPQTTGTDATSLRPNATVPTSQAGTGNKTLSVAKMGARVIWSGELDEDSIVPFASQLRMQLATAGAEQLEYVIIDGDTATGATTNINHIGGTPGSTDLFLLFDGFRKSALVTTTANSRSAGALTSSDFKETVKLMGSAGINALDISKVSFIIDPNTHWAALELPDVKTRDVNAAATIENGKLRSIYGYGVDVSAFMHFKSASRMANTSGKVDQTTTANNTTGSIVAVRWDQWKLGYKRRMTLETTRVPSSDSTEIVALMRVGLVQRDTEASAVSYGVTVS